MPNRPNRAQRRNVRGRKTFGPDVVHRDELRHMAILPGLPGSQYPYSSDEEREAFLMAETERVMDAISVLTPWMVWRRDWWERMGQALELLPPIRLRHRFEEAPDGMGAGVLLDAEPEVVRSTKRRKVILPGDLPVNGRGLILP